VNRFSGIQPTLLIVVEKDVRDLWVLDMTRAILDRVENLGKLRTW